MRTLGRLLYLFQRWYPLANDAHRKTGKRVAAQIIEAARLRLGRAQLRLREYYDFGLYDDGRFSAEAKRRFIGGRRASALYRRLNWSNWTGVSDDKLLFYSLLMSLGLPYPRLYAVYHPRGRPFGGVPCVTDSRALADLLRNNVPLPCFIKPARSKYGLGAIGIADFDGERLTLCNGEHLMLEAYLHDPDMRRWLDSFGALVQEHVSPHPAVEKLCGSRLASVRLIILLCWDGPRPLHAVLKIPTGRNMTDNFHHGTAGNLLAALDLETGTITRVVQGVGPGRSELEGHPDTGKRLVGVQLPAWRELLSTGVAGARALPGLRWQNWDIALAREGPLILEMNANADLDLVQHAAGEGIDDARLQAYLKQVAP